MSRLQEAQVVLEKYFGYSTFREGQGALVGAVLDGRDALGIMPTGAGKSLCYQVPAMVLEGMTVVISPLISLMKDQVDSLRTLGIEAGYLNSSLSSSEYREMLERARDGACRLLYVAPERLESVDFLELSQQVTISLVAIDEAHCVSQWGHDFRPSYTRIASYIRRLPVRPIVAAYTATATPRVEADIKHLLELDAPYQVKTGFDRPNLYFQVEKPKHKYHWIRDYITAHPHTSGIIYCNTRKTVDALYEKLRADGFSVSQYHAGLSEAVRKQSQDAFLYDETELMVATNAFGMGIDKSNVRFVLHCNMPKNMESYYQEAGRAGRDGLKSQCVMLYSPQDIMTNRFFIENGEETMDKTNEYEKLSQMVDYCNTEGCLRSYILNYFGEEETAPCGDCGNCQSEVEKVDITVDAQKILSCVKRMGERFGSGMVIDVLKGSKNKKMQQFHFETLTTYGIMKEYGRETLKEMIAYLVADKYLELTGDAYPVLAIGERGYAVLKGQETVQMRIVMHQEVEEVVGTMQPVDDGLFLELVGLRRRMATEEKVPPFMIFSDATLQEMAMYYPISEDELLQINGVGEVKYRKYGEAYVELIAHYVEEHAIERLPFNPVHKRKRKTKTDSDTTRTRSSIKQPTHEVTYALYKQGMSIQEIAKERDIAPMTIENHLVKAIEEGQAVTWEDFMTAQEERMICEVVEAVGDTLLKPIKEALPESITYTAIKVCLAKHKVGV